MRILAIFSSLILNAACTTLSPNSYADLDDGVSAHEVLDNFGAPTSVVKVMEYDVWTYQDSWGYEECQLFFKKKTFVGPAKCRELPVPRKISMRDRRAE